jgi:hypothetical protein
MHHKSNIGHQYVGQLSTLTIGQPYFAVDARGLDIDWRQDPNYQALLETLPDYKASLETRYPLVCERCMPLVEEKLLKKEHMARSKALGGWLNANARQGTPRRPGMSERHSSILRQPRERPWQARLWILQGTLYGLTTLWAAVSYVYGAFPSPSRDVFGNIYCRDGPNTITTRTDSKPIVYSYIYLLDLLESHMVAGSKGWDAHHWPERISCQFSPHSVTIGSDHVSYRESNSSYGHLDSSCQA